MNEFKQMLGGCDNQVTGRYYEGCAVTDQHTLISIQRAAFRQSKGHGLD